jgi:hypothetical protein
MLIQLRSIISCTCPKCKQGKLFIDPNPYRLKNIDKMVENCPVCDFSLKAETGFHWFSMYVSYGLSIGLSVFNYLWFGFIFGWSNIIPYIGVNAFILIAIWPLMFRWARMISIYLSLKFNLK